MRLLDLFCGAGGCSVGYARAGFELVGIDAAPQPRYPYEFVQADAMTYPLDGFDAIHASPPCHGHSALNVVNEIEYGTEWMLAATIKRLTDHGAPFIVENVAGARAHMPGALQLCGTEFGLMTRMESYGEVWLARHRLFLSNIHLLGAGGCHCYGRRIVGVYGHGGGGPKASVRGPGTAQASREVMGIDWMTRDELDEAIPPAYTQFLGEQLLDALERAA